MKWVENWYCLNGFYFLCNSYHNILKLTIEKCSPKRHFKHFIKYEILKLSECKLNTLLEDDVNSELKNSPMIMKNFLLDVLIL